MIYSSLIIGYGVVGKNLHEELKALDSDVYDKFKTEVSTKKDQRYDFGFVCVDTPLVNGKVDTTDVEKAISENDCDVYIIKSTCPVGTVDRLVRSTGKHIIFSPEYYGGTQHCNNFEFDFTVLGGNHDDCVKVQQLLQHCYDARHEFHITDAKTAEMVKFMENSWLATKVTFAVIFTEHVKRLISNMKMSENFLFLTRG